MNIITKNIKLYIGAILVVLFATALFFYFEPSLPVNKNAWQAVFLTNGQVYFGKLSSTNREYLELTKVFYLQSSQGINENSTGSADLNLIKLGAEIHGPEDKMYISRKQVIFWENLGPSSKIVKIITAYK